MVLFLNIKGAFPNAVPETLIHNLRKHKVPLKIIDFIEEMLANRATRLRFDDYKLDIIPIDNGIRQGDPLSMGLYQYYNADLLEIPDKANQLAIAYVDDTLLYAAASTFEEMHKILKRMMMKENSIIEWSKDHNSSLKYSKLALIDFAHQNHHTQ